MKSFNNFIAESSKPSVEKKTVVLSEITEAKQLEESVNLLIEEHEDYEILDAHLQNLKDRYASPTTPVHLKPVVGAALGKLHDSMGEIARGRTDYHENMRDHYRTLHDENQHSAIDDAEEEHQSNHHAEHDEEGNEHIGKVDDARGDIHNAIDDGLYHHKHEATAWAHTAKMHETEAKAFNPQPVGPSHLDK